MPNVVVEYKNLLTELIQKQMVILGPEIARETAQAVPGLIVDAAGSVTAITGDPTLVFHDIAEGYLALSGSVTQIVLYALLEKYPAVRDQYKEPLTKIKLVCSILEHHH